MGQRGFRYRSSVIDGRVVDEVTRLCNAGLDGTDLLRRFAETVRRAVPFDVYCASTVDPATNLMTRAFAEADDGRFDASEQTCAVFLDRIYFEHDRAQALAMLRERRTVSLLSEETGGKLEQSVRYREILRPHGMSHNLTAVFVDRSLWGSMDLIRHASRPDFSARDVELVRRCAPLVGAGLRAAALRSREEIDVNNADAPGVLMLDGQGGVVTVTAAAERHLADLDDLDPSWRTPRGLPIPVRMVAGALARAVDPASDRDRHLIPRLRVQGRSGRWLTLHGSLTEPAEGRPSERVVVIAPAHPEEVAWLSVAAYGLSPREEEVVKLVVRGFSTRQLSETLFISEHTVQRHLTNVFEKVGVRSRRDLLKRLFFDQLAPSLSTG